MIHIILNPVAGKGKAKKNEGDLIGFLTERRVEYKLYHSLHVGHAAELAREITENCKDEFCELVCVGGDGTLHEVVSGIADPAKVKLGLIPFGTGNDFAKACKLPIKNVVEGMRFILDHEAKPTDYILLNDTRSINVVGMGIDVDVLERCARAKIFKGKIGYYISLIASLFKFRWNKYQVRIDGGEEVFHSAMITAVCNGNYFGGGMNMSPESVLDDGVLNVVIVNEMKKSRMPGIFMGFMKGKILEYDVTTQYKCKEVEFITDAKPVINADGELIHGQNFKCRIVPKGILMYRA